MKRHGNTERAAPQFVRNSPNNSNVWMRSAIAGNSLFLHTNYLTITAYHQTTTRLKPQSTESSIMKLSSPKSEMKYSPTCSTCPTRAAISPKRRKAAARRNGDSCEQLLYLENPRFRQFNEIPILPDVIYYHQST